MCKLGRNSWSLPVLCFFLPPRAEPVLSRIQENRRRVILPSIDNIKQDNFEVQRYENSAHGYSWELWCMYISPPKDWWDAGDPSLPIRYVTELGTIPVLSVRC